MKPSSFEYIRVFARRRGGIVVDADKASFVESRLERVAQEWRLSGVDGIVDALVTNRNLDLPVRVMDALTTGETLFFRDGHPFEALTQQVLPELMRARATERRLAFWCAASSSGQEPYSIAMSLQSMGTRLGGWSTRILATDLCTAALKRTQEGRFSSFEVSRGLTRQQLDTYFERLNEGEFRARSELRDLIVTQQVNLVEPFPRLVVAPDVIFLRNVLIYFDQPTKAQVMSRMRRVIAPDGYLFLGATESHSGYESDWEPVHFGRTYALRPRRA